MEPSILLDDGDLIAVDKPAGAVVHPSPEHRDAGLVLLHWLRERAGHVSPVHRLDRPTSGIVLFARSSERIREAQAALESGRKSYYAAVRRVPPESGVMERPLHHLESGAQQEAVTHFERLGTLDLGGAFGLAALLRVNPETGRRHQIRRHFAHEAHHLLLDTQYGKGALNRHCREQLGLSRLFLHLAEVALAGGPTICSRLPEDLRAFLSRTGGQAPD